MLLEQSHFGNKLELVEFVQQECNSFLLKAGEYGKFRGVKNETSNI